ncbi:BatA domain-containing protein [Alienimonas sp. DA493]|uniref:BatA domain-containing protein n=1 Tax=Alienimonas sp. DA493 TaxID=3373605 RepID=UPI00375445EE
MSLLHPGLLALLGLAAVPVILHFLLKPKPKKFPFPALRLIRDRKKSNSRRLKLRHLWLLLLRMLAIVLLVLAVVRPSLPAANYSFTTAEWLTLAGVVVAVLIAYQVLLARWRSQQRRGELARHDLLYRRTLLRAGSTAGAFLLAALLVLWPYGRRVAAEVRAPVQAVTEDQPVAAVFLFDTSPSMGLIRAGENRLEAALALAAEHADGFPPGSKLAVMTTAPGETPRFAADLFGAKTRMQQLEVRPVTVPLDGRLAAAVDLHERDREQVAAELGLGEPTSGDAAEADAFVRAVYVFTDLARSAWGPGGRSELANTLAARERVQAFLVDVGAEGPENVAVGVPRPSRQSGPIGGTVTVRAPVSRAPLFADAETGEAEARGPLPIEVELRTGAVGEEPVARGRQTVTLPPGGAAEVSFSVPIAAAGAVEGELVFTGSDPLAFDDRRTFTIRAESPLRVAVASDRLSDARAFGEALAPSLLPEDRRPAVVTPVRTADLAGLDTGSFDVIYLLNARAPDAAAMAKLGAFAEAGGGVGVVLGGAADVLAYNAGPAAEWMPAELIGPLGFGVPERMTVADPNHPVFAPFDPLGGTGALESRDVRRYFVVEPKADVAVPAVYTDPQKRPPAVVTHGVEAGRVALVATSLIVDDADWSDLPDAGWSYLAFVKFLTRHLSGRSEQRFNFLAADTLVVPVSNATAGDGGAEVPAVLRRPDLSQRRLSIPADADEVAVTGADAPGQYVIARAPDPTDPNGGNAGGLLSAFSVNLPEAESDLTAITPEELDARLGEGRYALSRTAEELDLTTVRGRLGEEMFPYLLALLMAVFAGELLVGNRFYESEQGPAAGLGLGSRLPERGAVASGPVPATSNASPGGG